MTKFLYSLPCLALFIIACQAFIDVEFKDFDDLDDLEDFKSSNPGMEVKEVDFKFKIMKKTLFGKRTPGKS